VSRDSVFYERSNRPTHIPWAGERAANDHVRAATAAISCNQEIAVPLRNTILRSTSHDRASDLMLIQVAK